MGKGAQANPDKEEQTHLFGALYCGNKSLLLKHSFIIKRKKLDIVTISLDFRYKLLPVQQERTGLPLRPPSSLRNKEKE